MRGKLIFSHFAFIAAEPEVSGPPIRFIKIWSMNNCWRRPFERENGRKSGGGEISAKNNGRPRRRWNIDFQTFSFNICRLASSVFVGVLRANGRNGTNKFIKRFQSCTNRALTLTCQSRMERSAQWNRSEPADVAVRTVAKWIYCGFLGVLWVCVCVCADCGRISDTGTHIFLYN